MANIMKNVAGTAVVDVTFASSEGHTGPSNTAMDIADSDVIAEETERKQRELSPLRYCRFIAGNPKLAFGKTSQTFRHPSLSNP